MDNKKFSTASFVCSHLSELYKFQKSLGNETNHITINVNVELHDIEMQNFWKHFKEDENECLKSLLSSSLKSNLFKTADLDMPIEDMDYIGVRLYNALKSKKINKLSDIIKLSVNDILSIRNIGKRNLRDLEYALLKYNLSLAK
jgi:DNA-directed RNA polymerase alpha subunit